MAMTFPYKALKEIKIPTLVIHGDKDTYVPYEDSKEYAEYFQNGKFIGIEGAGHGFVDTKEEEKQANEETLKFFQKYC